MAFLSDSFTDTDGTDLQSHTGEGGVTWTEHGSYGAGALKIQTNRVWGTANSVCYASATSANADYDVEGDFYVLSAVGRTGIGGRIQTGSNDMYTFDWTTGTGVASLRVYIAGAGTVLATTTAESCDVGETHTFKLEMRGSTIKGYIDGVERASATDTQITVAGRPGIRISAAGTTTTGVHIASMTASNPVVAGRGPARRTPRQSQPITAPGAVYR